MNRPTAILISAFMLCTLAAAMADEKACDYYDSEVAK